MTEIEKGLFKIISKVARASKESGRRNTGTHTLIEGAVREALVYLDSEGMVRKVDRKLPKNPVSRTYTWAQHMEKSGYEAGQQDMIKAGCGFFEPLIKEEK